MNEKPKKPTGSLIERAAEVYDFGGLLRGKGAVDSVPPGSLRDRPPHQDGGDLAPANSSPTGRAGRSPVDDVHGVAQDKLDRRSSDPGGSVSPVDFQQLRASGFVIPGSPPTALSEEFRLVKRQLLLAAFGGANSQAAERGRTILICSAQPNEGKTFCSVNLALSMASETDLEMLLIDADVAKPEILSTLGLPGGAGLMDALGDPAIDPESLVIRTDIPNLSVLPAGKQSHRDTELLASDRTRALIDRLASANPRRILLFDSAPALAASPASVLALHVGQVLLVVRADQTSESELRDALTLVDACPRISLMLNAVTFSGSNRQFGSYYGFGD